MSRMRAGEWIAALGAVGLFVTLFLDWFGLDGGAIGRFLNDQVGPGTSSPSNLHALASVSASGWSTLGWLTVALLCVLIFAGAALSYMTIKRASPAWPVGAGVLTWILGSVIFLILVVRVTIAQPGTDAYVAVKLPAYLGLLFAASIPLGAFLSLRDERTRTAESLAYVQPPPRTAPGT
jgi:hypothetical protein